MRWGQRGIVHFRVELQIIGFSATFGEITKHPYDRS